MEMRYSKMKIWMAQSWWPNMWRIHQPWTKRLHWRWVVPGLGRSSALNGPRRWVVPGVGWSPALGSPLRWIIRHWVVASIECSKSPWRWVVPDGRWSPASALSGPLHWKVPGVGWWTRLAARNCKWCLWRMILCATFWESIMGGIMEGDISNGWADGQVCIACKNAWNGWECYMHGCNKWPMGDWQVNAWIDEWWHAGKNPTPGTTQDPGPHQTSRTTCLWVAIGQDWYQHR